MLMIKKQWFEGETSPRDVGVGLSLALLNGIAGAVLAVQAQAAVVEFYNPDLNNYFITAEPVEQDFVDTGAVGRWQRTGNAFATGGPNQVCRFYGNGTINPATGTMYGPNSHFYTANPVECDGLKAQFTPNARSWKFESNDFATTPAVSNGCPAGLVPVYRAYNNGFPTIDSNHRITSRYAAYQATVAAGWVGEGVVMCAPPGHAPPAATAVGTAVGSPTGVTIGAAGGSASTPDGKIVLTIPAGALVTNTAIVIQPLTNLAHGKIGAAYRLTPQGQTFLKPITITFTYTAQDLLGTAAEFLGAAFQTADGFWQWAGDATVDPAAKTVSVASSHFSDWSNVRGLQLRPPEKTVRVNGSVGLQVRVCYPVDDGELVTLGRDCDTDQGIVAALSINEWSVNGRLGGGGVFGTVSGSGAKATYTAPATEPVPNTVAVSARVHHSRSGQSAGTLLVSNITIVGAWNWKVDGTYWDAYHLTGIICNLGTTFALQAQANLAGVPATGVFTFTPAGTSGGTWAFSGTMDGLGAYTGNGAYQLAGVASGTPRLLMDPGAGTWIIHSPLGTMPLGAGGDHLNIVQTITMAETTEPCPVL